MTLILDQFGRPTGGAATPFALPQPLTFSSIFGGAQYTYFHSGYDQAFERSREDALLMRNDCFLMGLLQERKLGTAGLRWHLEVDDERDPWQRMARDHMEAAARSVKHLPRDVFMPLMEAVWPGRSGVQCVWKWREQTPPPISIPAMNGLPSSSTPLGPVRTLALDLKAPVNGDKIGHRYSGLPYVEVNVAEGQELAGAETIVTTQTRAMLLKGSWRDRFLLHTHAVEDPDYFDAKRGDMVYGVGVRSVLFWHDWLKREYLAWLTDFLERYGLGLTLVSYDESNAQSKLAAQKIIDDLNGRKMAVMVPVIPGQSTLKDALARIETPQSAAEVILKLMKLFDHYIRYYVLGDESGEEGRSKGGDEVREMTSAKWKMYRLDALNLADTLTSDYLDLVKRWTFPWADFPVRWRFDLDSPDVGERIGAMNKLWDMGVRFKEDEARGLLGMSKPQEGDDTISKAQQLEQEASLKAATMDPNRTAQGTFATKGKTAEEEATETGVSVEPPGGNEPEPQLNGAPMAKPGEAEQFVRVYKGRPASNPAFEEKHKRSPMGDHDPKTGHSSNPDGGDWEEGGPNPQTGGGKEPAKPPAPKPPPTKPPGPQAAPAPVPLPQAAPAPVSPPVPPPAPKPALHRGANVVSGVPAGTTAAVPYQDETHWETGKPQPGTLNGVDFAPAPAKFWEQTKDVDVGEPPSLKPINRVGVLIQEPDGRIWIVQPTNQFGNRKHTLPGGGVEQGLTNQQNALKEVWEETGLQVEITGVAGDFIDSNNGNNGRLYIGRRVGGAPWDAKVESFIIDQKTGLPAAESASVSLVTPEKAAQLLHRTDDLAQLMAIHPIPLDTPVQGAGSNALKKFVDAIQPAKQAYIDQKKAAGQAYGNADLHVVQEMRGFNGKPQVVTDADFDALMAQGGHIEMLRGLSDHGITTGDELADQFRTGDHFSGHGVFGSGTYCDSTKGYGNAAQWYAGYGAGAVLRIALPKTAKIVNISELEQKVPTNPAAFKSYWATGGKAAYECWMGVQAALAGYDAVYVDGKSSRHGSYGKGFYVILNRSILTVQDKSPPNGYTIP